MQTKNNRPLPVLPLSAEVTAAPSTNDAPAKGLSAALGAALGGKAGKAQFPGKRGAPHHPDAINKAPKPVGGANRTLSPRKGHR
jgi:hypothetical protein